MGKVTKAVFDASTATVFADNTNEDISEGDFRTKWTDVSASTAFLEDVNTFSKQQRFNKGEDVISAAVLPLITDGNYFDVTGVVTITSFADLGGAGAVITLQFDGILTLTHHATDLILPAGGNITTAAGDHATFVNYASGDYRCINYQRADGTAIASSAGAGDALVANGLNQFAATTSAQLAGVISDETGAGALVFAESPTLVTPALGTPASGVMTNATGTATGLTSGITNGLKSTTTTVNVSAATAPSIGQILTATGTAAATWQTPATSGDALTTDKLDQFAATTSAELRGVISDETGTGALVFGSSPTLVTPALGTPASGVATNITGLPVTGLANGTDGELITWSAAGVAETVAVGTATHVLTSNGVGVAPTFQANGTGDVVASATVYDYLYIDAAAMIPSTTNGAAAGSRELATNDVMIDYLAFDTATDEYAQYKWKPPEQIVSNAVIRFKFDMATETGAATTLIFGTQFIIMSDDESLDQAWSTAQVAGAVTMTTTNDIYMSDGACTATLTGIAAGDTVFFRVFRDVSADTHAVDGQLLGVHMQIPVNNTATSVWS